MRSVDKFPDMKLHYLFRPRSDLAGLRLFPVAMAGDQGFARAFKRLPVRLLCAQRSADVRIAQWLQRHGTPTRLQPEIARPLHLRSAREWKNE